MDTKKPVILMSDNEKNVLFFCRVKKCSGRETRGNTGLRFLMTALVTPLSEYQECSQQS